MKIISKYKDFYDYLSGIYGIDDKVVLDRTDYAPSPKFPSEDSRYTFYICGMKIEGLYRDGKFHYGSDLEKFDKYREGSRSSFLNDRDYYYILIGNRLHPFGKRPMVDLDKINDKLNCPILIEDIYGEIKIGNSKFSKFPILKDYDFKSVYDAKDLWIMIYNFLSREKPIKNNQTDKEKIISKGFDYKNSFRNTK